MDYHTIGANIKTERKKQHMTQEQLAEKAGISTNFLACIETGIKKGSFETYVNLANALHVTLDTLTLGVVSACSENPLKEDLNYYFDNAPEGCQELIVDLIKNMSSGFNKICESGYISPVNTPHTTGAQRAHSAGAHASRVKSAGRGNPSNNDK